MPLFALSFGKFFIAYDLYFIRQDALRLASRKNPLFHLSRYGGRLVLQMSFVKSFISFNYLTIFDAKEFDPYQMIMRKYAMEIIPFREGISFNWWIKGVIASCTYVSYFLEGHLRGNKVRFYGNREALRYDIPACRAPGGLFSRLQRGKREGE